MPDLLYEKRGNYAIFTMNRPDRLNAIGGTMGDDLNDALTDFTNDPSMRVGILTGTGRAFSAGADLKAMSERNADMARIEAEYAEGKITLEQRRELVEHPDDGRAIDARRVEVHPERQRVGRNRSAVLGTVRTP